MYRSASIVRVNKCRRLRQAEHVARMEEGRSAFKILIDKSTGMRPVGRTRRRLEDNIRINLTQIGVDWVQDKDYWRALECDIDPPGP